MHNAHALLEVTARLHNAARSREVAGRRSGPGDALDNGRMIEESRRWFDRAARVSPGGVNSPVRAFRAVGGTPRFIVRAEGPWLTDADGNQLLDFVGSWGPMLLGH